MRNKKRLWRVALWIGLALYLYPFLLIAASSLSGLNWGVLYTFEMGLKDFLKAWIPLGGVVAVVIGVFQTQRRITQQEKQFDKQIEKQNEQIELQRKQQCDARFASGVELLGNTHESTRIGGAYSLYYLAHDSKEYLTTVCNILCAHLRSIANKDKFQTEEEREKYPDNEIRTFIDLLLRPIKNGDKYESIFMEESKNLKNIFLYKIHFNNSIDLVDKLKHINFSGSELTKMSFHGTSILDVNFTNSLLYRVGFTKTTLERVGFINPQRFSLIDFWGATLVKYQNPNYEKEEGEYKTVNFTGTPLESIPYEKITEPWFSWKLTTPWVVKK